MMDFDMLLLLVPALITGILVLSTHVLFGRQVLKRGIIFIDLAIAQIAALGAIFARTQHDLTMLPFVQVWLPAVCAVVGALLIAQLAKYFADELEAMIGSLYVLAAVFGMLILAKDAHGAELLKQLMSGQILWVSWEQLLLPSIVYGVILLTLIMRPSLMHGRGFYLLFALVITLSVELVGVYLVFSSLILPALAVNKMMNLSAIWWAYGVGMMGYLLGLLLSMTFDLPSGAMIVVCLSMVTIAFRVLSAKKSLKNS
ncbi:metal ABC transporter permease [Parashewanella spongiae]|uniref:Metal ABC transporter permease n=1 Tax=Parashewanella spongiae TaxID=342950 RepID=A0A3A6TL17_9GAMM|nr:metal ABC transporter permease [Parashewanella spongiae]MCL1079435.1 metal ABC transporter permease [Parashewanella spongiae]RJY13202.1 metal ABC transporter permease [Parashewanella spongiae]